MNSNENDNNLAIYQSIIYTYVGTNIIDDEEISQHVGRIKSINDGYKKLKQIHVQEKYMVYGYLRQKQRALFQNKSAYFNLHSVSVVILLYCAGLITLIVEPSQDKKEYFGSFEWSVYPSSIMKDLKNGIISRIPSQVRGQYINKQFPCGSRQKPELDKTVSEHNMHHLSRVSWHNKVVVKVGMLGDSETNKTKLMVKYIEDKYDEDYIETLGVNFMEKTITLKNVDVTISVWDLGGQREFATLMPLVCSDAKVIIFAFDSTQKQSLFSVKRWYKEARKQNKTFMPFLVGTKFHLFDELEDQHKQDITKQARKFANKMHAPLIYCSAVHSINVKKIFKIIIAKVFDLKPKIKEQHDCLTGPIIEWTLSHYEDVNEDNKDNEDTNNNKFKKHEKGKQKKEMKKKKKKKKDKKIKKDKKNEKNRKESESSDLSDD